MSFPSAVPTAAFLDDDYFMQYTEIAQLIILMSSHNGSYVYNANDGGENARKICNVVQKLQGVQSGGLKSPNLFKLIAQTFKYPPADNWKEEDGQDEEIRKQQFELLRDLCISLRIPSFKATEFLFETNKLENVKWHTNLETVKWYMNHGGDKFELLTYSVKRAKDNKLSAVDFSGLWKEALVICGDDIFVGQEVGTKPYNQKVGLLYAVFLQIKTKDKPDFLKLFYDAFETNLNHANCMFATILSGRTQKRWPDTLEEYLSRIYISPGGIDIFKEILSTVNRLVTGPAFSLPNYKHDLFGRIALAMGASCCKIKTGEKDAWCYELIELTKLATEECSPAHQRYFDSNIFRQGIYGISNKLDDVQMEASIRLYVDKFGLNDPESRDRFLPITTPPQNSVFLHLLGKNDAQVPIAFPVNSQHLKCHKKLKYLLRFTSEKYLSNNTIKSMWESATGTGYVEATNDSLYPVPWDVQQLELLAEFGEKFSPVIGHTNMAWGLGNIWVGTSGGMNLTNDQIKKRFYILKQWWSKIEYSLTEDQSESPEAQLSMGVDDVVTRFGNRILKIAVLLVASYVDDGKVPTISPEEMGDLFRTIIQNDNRTVLNDLDSRMIGEEIVDSDKDSPLETWQLGNYRKSINEVLKEKWN
tara:strand:- start:12980 stop:14911 length:1932 start_codon:yes stop_codon:yes gene_type:complete